MERQSQFETLKSELGLHSGNPGQTFETKAHTEDEIKRAKDIIKMSRAQKKGVISNFAKDKSTNPYVGRQLKDLLELYKAKDEQLMRTIDKFENIMRPKDFTSSQLGMTYEERQKYDRINNQALNDYVLEKTGFLATSKNIDDIAKHLGVKIDDNLTRTKFKELIALDDWGTIASMAAPLIIEHGPKAINWLWEKFVKKLQGWTAPGQDAGLWIGDYNNNNVQKPSKQSYQQGVNVGGAYQTDRSSIASDQYCIDGVNTDFLATYICPERHRYREPSMKALKTGVVAGSTTFTLTTDTNGNTMFSINPNNVDANSVNFLRTFAFYNPQGYDPSTGLFTNAATLSGPVSQAPVTWCRVSSMSVQVIPITSVNTSQGNFQVAYFPLVQANGVGTGPYDSFNQQDIMISQYYQSGNSLTSYRMIRITDDKDNWHAFGQATSPTDPNEAQYEYFAGIITGAQPNTSVAVVNVYYVVEVIPQPEQAQLTIMDYPMPGVRTSDLIYNLNFAFPAIQMLTYEQSVRLADIIRKSKKSYYNVLEAIMAYSSAVKVKGQFNMPITNNFQDDMSFEIERD